MQNAPRKQGYKDLIVWQKAMDLVVEVYKLIKLLPVEEKFGLGSQMGRSAVSIVSNIAEGWGRNSQKSFKQFIYIALASGMELETQVEIVRRLGVNKGFNLSKIDAILNEVLKMLYSLSNK